MSHMSRANDGDATLDLEQEWLRTNILVSLATTSLARTLLD